jgi:glycosyltransferase involved in cell wall biosynthesis
MNIAVFIKSTTFHRGSGGLESQNKSLCEELVRRGHSVTVFSPKREITIDEKIENLIKYVFITAEYRRYIFALMNKNSWFKKSLEKFQVIHRASPFDLVLSQSASAESIIENKEKLGVRVVSVAHGSAASEYKTFLKNIKSLKDIYWLVRNTQYFLRQFFGRQRRYVLHSNKVIAVSNYVKSALINECFADERRIEVVHNGVDPRDFDVIEKSSDENVKLLFLGRVEKSKGIFTILKIISRMNSKCVLHVVGDGPDLEEAKKYSKKINVSDKVVFHGKVPYKEFVKNLKPDIFVFPTQRIEGFPMVLVESMLLGLPIVAFDLGGVSDALENEKSGYLVRAGDTKEFRIKLESLINDPVSRNTFGIFGRTQALSKFTIGTMINAYEKIFTEVLE